ncbi:FAD/NAD(P)-binding protein [Corynebacterium variabile]|uniref:FAD-NAD(P)-binding n=2 Tax=Corynebacterium variabile TaxID=1727 RepID=A0A0X2NPT1_9CORY|nr:FAD/NAD(P)-binding protein [Corynebacterium variabile]CUU66721.1 FAD-NAD(P)-binding [Corynebacterium variabile]
MSRALVIVGAGPRTTGILLALAALPEVPATEIHVIDPYPAGPGRIWRAVQPTEVWMNNTSDEITVYADGDPAVPAAVPGPGLAEWAGERHFVPRRDAAAYLRDAFERAVAVLTDPATHPGITVTEHRTRAEHVTPPDGASGRRHRTPGRCGAAGPGASRCRPGRSRHSRGGHIPPGYTVDQDFSAIPAGEDVLVRGFGLAFIDLMEILTEGRGGRFERGAGDAVPTYVPSGREPVLWVGSRRGVPYRSKPVDGPPAVELHHLVPATLDGIPRTPDGHLEPGHLRRLLTAELHGQWSAVTDEPLDLRRIDRPLDGLAFPDRHAVGREVEAVVLTNLGRATDRRHPQDGLLYSTLVASYFVLHSLLVEGLLDDADRDLVAQVEGSFSYVCSGPSPERLGNLLALHRAGVVRFLGPDTWFRRNPGAGPRFLADSPVVVGDPVTADHLVDARLAQVTVPRVTDPVLRGLLADGELVAGTGASGAAESVFVVDGDNRAVGADGVARDGLFLVGPSTSDPVREGFGRPGQRTRVFPANRRVAEAVADALVGRPQKLSPASR